MRGWVRQSAAFLTAATLATLANGCVDRRFVITSNPPGAIVYDEKNMPLGATPVDKQFIYYGKYRFTLVKDGCQTFVVEERVRAPWYEWYPLDFISENLVPLKLRDIRRFHYDLPPGQVVPPEAILEEANRLKLQGQSIGTPVPPPAGEILQTPGVLPPNPPPTVVPVPPAVN